MLQPKIIAFPLLATLVTGLLCDAADGQRKRSSWRDRTGLEHLVFKSDQTFDSKSFGGKATYSVFLPKDYADKKNEKTRYPVIYFLHGMREDQNRFQVRGGATVLDSLVGKGTIPQLIFVCAYDGSRSSFYINRGDTKVEDMIVTDLVKHIDDTYRTKAERASRAILGVSMGGFGAMKIAFKYPDVFGVVATHSAAILPEKSEELDEMFPWARQSRLAAALFGNPVDQKRWAAESPLVLANTVDAAKLRTMQIYFDCGDRDRYGLDATNLLLHKALDERKIPHVWKLVKGGGHGWNTRSSEVGYNVAALPDSLGFITQAWARAKATKKLAETIGGNGIKNPGKPDKK